MGKPLSYVLTFLAGLAFGAVAGTIAKPKGKKPSHAKVCGDLKLIHDLEVADSKAASRKGDSAAAAEHAKNADYTKDWANKGGCSWLASEARLAERRGVGFTPGPGTSPTRPRRSGRPEKLRAGPE